MRFQTLEIFLCFALTIAISQAYPVYNAADLSSRDNSLSNREAKGIDQEATNLIGWINGGIKRDRDGTHHGETPEISPVPHHLPRKRGHLTIDAFNPLSKRDRDGPHHGETPQMPPGQLPDDPIHHQKRDKDGPQHGMTPVIPNGDGNIYPTIPIDRLPPK